ncbi:uncharacterized protein LOC141685206 [Apium graveolens]|uniref:uncharacterized protein LOC141685206 n=1 Tax=Apium graveolens TaxID=4045 RepID=UPI003D7947AB
MIGQVVAQAVQQALANQENQNGEGNQNGKGNQNGQGNQNGNGNQNQNGQGHQLEPFVWLERFVKQKPDSFSTAPTPIDAENWIGHLEKIFDALGCDEIQKVRLAVYKLEGDAQRWWRGVKATKGDQYAEALEWQGFKEVFYEQYFSNADRVAYLREFHSIVRHHDESITDYMSYLRGSIISFKFDNLAEVAVAAKDVEKEHIDFRTSRSNSGSKRTRDDQGFVQGIQWYEGQSGQQGQWRGQNQNRGGQSFHGRNQYVCQNQNQQFQRQKQPRQWQNRQQRQSRYSVYGGNPNMIPVAPCATCGGHHPGRACYRQTGACFLCGSMSHRAAANSGTVSGTHLVGRRDPYVLFDTGSTHSVMSLSFVRHLGVAPSLLYPHMSIATPMGNSVIISDIYPECLIVVGDRNYKVNLLPMEMHDFDVILGMDWLSEHRATIDCQGKRVIFGDADKPEFVYQGSQPKGDVKLISALKASKLLSKGCDGYLAFVKDTSKDEPRIEDYPVVRDYEDVFPDELPGLPPHREVEFTIELVPGAEPISKAPYRMAPVELQELKEQLQELLNRGFLRPIVSPWGAPEVAFLGHIVSGRDIELDPAKVEAITNWPRPSNVTELRSFLGLTGHYMRFVEGFSSIALHLTQLMRKGIKFEWNYDREKSFQELKKRLVSAPIIVLPSESGGFQVYSDASKRGLGFVLMQHGNVISYASRQLKPYEVNYPTHDLEGSGGSIASLKVEPNLISRAKEAQKSDTGLQGIRYEMAGGKQTHFYVDEEGVIWLGGKLCVPADTIIREEILKEAHSSSFFIHPGSTKIETTPVHELAEIFQRDIVRLHGVPVSIVSDRDTRFTSHFWKGFQQAWGTRLNFSTAYHPQTDGQSERTIQILKDMLRAYALEWTGDWDKYLYLVEFAYNNS